MCVHVWAHFTGWSSNIQQVKKEHMSQSTTTTGLSQGRLRVDSGDGDTMSMKVCPCMGHFTGGQVNTASKEGAHVSIYSTVTGSTQVTVTPSA
ncbi:hypothetical protein J6590_034852 [Homalodisca vitripennis]|nr:hypothetical protein J6590_034852 [Homalodisca vitripennis]